MTERMCNLCDFVVDFCVVLLDAWEQCWSICWWDVKISQLLFNYNFFDALLDL